MRVCDKCGNPLNTKNLQQQTNFPYYMINILYVPTAFCSGTVIDLCDECRKKIIDFIEENKEVNNEQ